MTASRCEQITVADLTDYAGGECDATATAALEEHVFSCVDCGARAAEFDGLLRAIRSAIRSAGVGGFVTDAVLNRLSRDGVRVRSYTLTPGAIVPCAVWDDDEMMALRLRGDFGGVRQVTLTRRIAGTEVARVTSEVAGDSSGEIVHAVPAAWIREVPAVEVQLELLAREGDTERSIGSYTLLHGGVLHRRS
ncbi:MAG TPA: zf-HC2 domain-containing protein [Vicinamibacterales bacterium]|nr:zf-HC2 domain-containing protein [Vicinamibacterales bacterium]